MSAWLRRTSPLVAAVLMAIHVPVWAFDEIGYGARAPGMADAHVAVADDADATAYNPAGLIQLGQKQLSTQFGEHNKGLSDGSRLTNTYLGYGQPIRLGYSAFGVALQNFESDDLMTERTLILGYGQRLNVEPFGWRGIWSVGANAKQLHREYKSNSYMGNAIGNGGLAVNRQDPLFESGTSVDAYTADVGALYQFGRGYRTTAGLAITNITRPDLSLNGDGDKAPSAMKLGLAYRPDWGLMTAELRRVRRLASAPDSELALGAERSVRLADMGALTFRGGYAEGSRDYKAITAGLSYYFGRFRLDYAFKFPIAKLSDTDGSHRLGFSVKFGKQVDQRRSDAGPMNLDLLNAFESDSRASSFALDRATDQRYVAKAERELLLQLLMRRYPIDDKGLERARREYRDMLMNGFLPPEWPRLKFGLIAGAPMTEKDAAANALELLVKGESEPALRQLSALTAGREDRVLSTARLMTLSELAAHAYRAKDYKAATLHVREMLNILPSDTAIIEGYRRLLTLLNNGDIAPKPEALPEAPAILTGPSTPSAPKQTRDAMEERARSFGTALGYYLTRKSEGASVEILLELLKQMRAVYGETGMDMSIVEREISAITNALNNRAPAPKPDGSAPSEVPVVSPKPTNVPIVVPAPAPSKATPKVKTPAAPTKVPTAPVPATPAPRKGVTTDRNPEMERAWEYYKAATTRDITDAERLEILESMRRRFGDQDKIVREIQRIRKRLP